MAETVVREDLCGRFSGSCGSMWPSQWFMRIDCAEFSVIREEICGRVSGSRGSMCPSQGFMRIYGA